jgi:mono/diheme cytochrome c family protein
MSGDSGDAPTTVPRWLDWAFGLSAVALAVLVGIALQREVARPIVAGQRVLPGLGVVDRCEHCHTADTHPGTLAVTHPPERFGCTTCHGGQGWAVTADAAHRAQPDWERPLFTPAEREVACGRCHVRGALAGAPALTRGRALLGTLGCAACHDAPDDPDRRAGPPLDGLRDQVTPAWVRHWLSDPASLDTRHRMPRFRLSAESVEALVAYLWTRPEPELRALPEGGDADRGRTAVASRRCATCHAIEGRGGDTAVSLDHSGAKLAPAWLFSYLTAPHVIRPGTAMPDIRLSDAEAADVVAYATEQLVPDTAAPPWARFEGAVQAERAAEGGRLFAELGCAGCHTIAGVAPVPTGVRLADLSRRRTSDLPRPATGEPAADLPSYVARKVLAPADFDTPGAEPARMPGFTLSPEDALAVGVAVSALAPAALNFTTEYIRDSAKAPFTPPPGEIGGLFERFRCLVCHRLGGRGGDVSRVPLDGEGTRVQRAWLAGFLKAPTTLRMSQAERMPVLGLTDAEAEALAAWISLTLTSDAPALGALPAGDAARGRALYTARRCGECHTVSGEGGMQGPVLDGVGERLRGEYLAALLVDPARVLERRHGDRALPPAEAADVAAYLGGLRGEPALPGSAPPQ